MLYLITATPGSGKSQYAIERFILDAIRENEAAIAAWDKKPNDKPRPLRRQVYTNIKGMMRPDRVAKIQALVGGLPILPSPDDWRTCPDGSIVIYDEAQQKHLFRATGKPGAPDDERMTDFDTHRHRGFDIVLITQEVGLVHHWAKKFVGCHIHLERPSGIEMMTVREWGEVQPNPKDHFACEAADTSMKVMSKATWELYDSATVHTHTFKMPSGAKYAIRAFLALAVLIPLGFWLLATWGAPEVKASEPVSVDAPRAASIGGPLFDEVAPVLPRVSAVNGCALGRHCRCWNNDGEVMEMTEGQCRSLAEGLTPMPIDLNRFQDRGRREGAPGVQGREGAAPAAPGPPAGITTAPGSVGSPRGGEVQGV